MSRVVTVGAAQLGPIQRADARPQVVKRLFDLLHRAKAHGCDLVVFPEHYRMIVDRAGAVPPP